jgi:GH24 family phage-related lysozyme (muramidase)
VDASKLKALIKGNEGYSSFMYECGAHTRTIAWGHNIDANGLPRDIEIYVGMYGVITPTMAERLLDMDIAVAIKSCKLLYPEFDEFSESRQMALIDFVFNVGYKTATAFTNTNNAITEGRWEDAAKGLENSAWYSQVKNRAKKDVAMIREG